ncbi:MAG: hypothetical protein ACPGSO_00650 [Vicingaceae bacterium]
MYSETFLKLTKRFLPKGRAFKAPINGALYRTYNALSLSESRAYEDTLSILDSILPDNNNFTTEDAEDWERRLGLITNNSVPLSDRKLAIERKYNHPGTIPARQHYLYIEHELQAAGFNVNVIENRQFVGFGNYDLLYIPSGTVSGFEMGDNNEMGNDVEMGGSFSNEFEIVTNHIDSIKDENFFNLVPNQATYELMLRSSFFVANGNYSTPVNVLASRKNEFRQLILKLKPAQSIGLLNVNYI